MDGLSLIIRKGNFLSDKIPACLIFGKSYLLWIFEAMEALNLWLSVVSYIFWWCLMWDIWISKNFSINVKLKNNLGVFYRAAVARARIPLMYPEEIFLKGFYKCLWNGYQPFHLIWLWLFNRCGRFCFLILLFEFVFLWVNRFKQSIVFVAVLLFFTFCEVPVVSGDVYVMQYFFSVLANV